MYGLARPPRITVSNEQAERIEELAGEDGLSSKSEVMRYFVQWSLGDDDLERENDRLHRERRQLLEQPSENEELRRYIEDEQRYRLGRSCAAN